MTPEVLAKLKAEKLRRQQERKRLKEQAAGYLPPPFIRNEQGKITIQRETDEIPDETGRFK